MAEERQRMREFNLSDGHRYKVPEDKADWFLGEARGAGLEAEEYERVDIPGSGVYRIPKSRREEFEKEVGVKFDDVDPRMTNDEWLAWRKSRDTRAYRRARTAASDREAFDEEQKQAQFGQGSYSSWASLDEDEARDAEAARRETAEAVDEAKRRRVRVSNRATRLGASMADTAEGMVHAAEVEGMPWPLKIANDAVASVIGIAGGLLTAAGDPSAAWAGVRRAGDRIVESTVRKVGGAAGALGFGMYRGYGRAVDEADAIVPERAELRRLATLDAEGRLDDEGRARLAEAEEAVRSRVASLSMGERARFVRALEAESDAAAVLDRWGGEMSRLSDEIDDAAHGRAVEDIAGALSNSYDMALSYFAGKAIGAIAEGAGWVLSKTGVSKAVGGAASAAAGKLADSAAGRAAGAAVARASAAVAARPMMRKGIEGIAKVARACAGKGIRSTLVMSLPEYANAYMAAVEAGAPDSAANAAGLWSFGVAAFTEHLPLDAIRNKAGAGLFRHLLEAAVNEGGQEYVQSLCGNAVNLLIYRRLAGPDGEKYALSLAGFNAYARALFEGAAEEGVAGGFAGMLMGAGAHAMPGAAARRAMERRGEAIDKLLSTEATTPEGRSLRAALVAIRKAAPDFVPDIDPGASDAENLRRLVLSPAQIARMAEAERSGALAPQAGAAAPSEAPAPEAAGEAAAPEAPAPRPERALTHDELVGQAKAVKRWLGHDAEVSDADHAPQWVKDEIAAGRMKATDRGCYDPETGRLWLHEGAATETTAAHEVWHGTVEWARRNSPELYKALLDIGRNAPQDVKDMVLRDYAGMNMSGEMEADEFGALLFELTQRGRIDEMLRDEASRTWWTRLKEAFLRIIGRAGGNEAVDAASLAKLDGADLMDAIGRFYAGRGTLAGAQAAPAANDGGRATSDERAGAARDADVAYLAKASDDAEGGEWTAAHGEAYKARVSALPDAAVAELAAAARDAEAARSRLDEALRGDDDNAIEAAEDAVLAAEDRLGEVSRRLGVSDADIAEAVDGGEANPGTPDGAPPDSGVRLSRKAPLQPGADLSDEGNAKALVSWIDSNPGTKPPPMLVDGSPKSAYRWFRENLLGKTFRIGDRTFTPKEGHFFRFVCETPKQEGVRKGWIGAASSPEEARAMVESGAAGAEDIAGYVPSRARSLPFVASILTDWDAVLRRKHKLYVVKKFDTGNRNSDIAVFLLNEDGATLGLESMHVRVVGRSFLNGSTLVATRGEGVVSQSQTPLEDGSSPGDIAEGNSAGYAATVPPPAPAVNPPDSGVRASRGAPAPEQEAEEARRQYDGVVAAHTNPDGTRKPSWMKAPDGKPTRLSERQWVQARTENFKRWFGDWETAATGKAVRGIEPVALREPAPGTDVRAAYEAIGEAENERDGRKVRFVNATLGKILRHQGYDTSRIVPQLGEIFRGSIHISFEGEREQAARPDGTAHKKHPNFVGYHNYVGKFRDGAKTYYVRFTVQEERTRKRDYNPFVAHSTFVSDVEVYEMGGSSLSRSTTSVGERENAAKVDRILADYLARVNGAAAESSKIVDSNGEPLVVYHGSAWNPLAEEPGRAVFDPGRIGATDDGIYGRGFYFSTSRGTSEGYGRNVSSLFLDIRNPLRLSDFRSADEIAAAIDAEPDAFRMAAEGWPVPSHFPGFASYAKAAGYDGIVVDYGDQQELVAFSPEQVKSATDNSGAFSAHPDIRLSRRSSAALDELGRAMAAAPGAKAAPRSAPAEAARKSFPEITWDALPRDGKRRWAYDPDGKRALLADPTDTGSVLRAVGAHADLRWLGNASGLMLARAEFHEGSGTEAGRLAGAAIRRAEEEIAALGRAELGERASRLDCRRAGFSEAFRQAMEDPAALRRASPAAALYIDACLSEAEPAFGRKLVRIREAMTRAALATPGEKVRLFMSDGKPAAGGAPGMGEMVAAAKAKARDVGDAVQEHVFDEYQGFIRAWREAGVDPHDVPPDLEPWTKCTDYQNTAAARAAEAFDGRGLGSLIGERIVHGSLADALKAVKDAGKLDDFCEFAVATVAKMRNAHGTPSGLTDAECDESIRRLDSPMMRKALADYTAWHQAVLHLLVDCGAWTEAEYRRVVDANPTYVPFHRVLPDGDAGGRRDSMKSVPVWKFKGSNLGIHDIIGSSFVEANRIINRALRLDVMQTVVKAADWLKARSAAARAESDASGEAARRGAPFLPAEVFADAAGAREVPLSALRTLKDEPQESVREASRRMDAARAGRGAKRAPLVVADNGDGTYTVVDGTATAHAIAGSGGAAARVVVAGPNRGTRLRNSGAYAVRKSSDGADADGELRTHGLDGLSGEAARERAYEQAEANMPLLADVVGKAAAKVGGRAAFRGENKDAPGADPREVGKRVKKRARVDEKTANDYGGDYARVVDLIGGTIAMPDSGDFADAIKALRENLPEGASIAKVKPFHFGATDVGYQDIKVSIRFPNGGIGEVILVEDYLGHAKSKRGGHTVYDAQRVLDGIIDRADKGEIDLPPEARRQAEETLATLREFSEAIYARGAEAATLVSDFERMKALAASQVQDLLPIVTGLISSKEKDAVKSSSAGFHLAKPPSVDSYATPARSFIQNDISSSLSPGIMDDSRAGVKPGAEALRPLAKFLVEVEAPVRPVRVGAAEAVEGLRKAAAESGADGGATAAELLDELEAMVAGDGPGAGFDVWRRGDAPAGVERVVVDGAERWVRPGEALRRALDALGGRNRDHENWVMKAFKADTTVTRALATTYNATFIVRNLARDAQTIAITSEYQPPVPLWAQIAGFAHAARRKFGRGGDASENYFGAGLAGGGGMRAYATERGRESARRRIAGARTAAGRFWDGLHAASVGVFEKACEAVEANPRIAEYCAALKYWKAQGMTDAQAHLRAAAAARLCTIDFARSGSDMHAVNRAILFSNAAVQGFDQTLRALGAKAALPTQRFQRPGRRFARTVFRAAVGVSLGSLAVYLHVCASGMLKRWRRQRDRDRFTGFLVPVGEGDDAQFLRIPYTESAGRFWGGLPIALIEYRRLMDEGDEEEASKTIRAFAEAVTGVRPEGGLLGNFGESALEGVVSGLLPTIGAPLVQAGFNRRWNGVPIEPEHFRHLKLEERFDESTWDICRELGPGLGISPMKLQYIMEQYTCNVAASYLGSTSSDAADGDRRAWPVIGRMFTEPGGGRQLADFRERRTNIEAALQSCSVAAESGVAPAYQVTAEDVGELELLKRIDNGDDGVRKLAKRMRTESRDVHLTKTERLARSNATRKLLNARLEEAEALTEAQCRDAGLAKAVKELTDPSARPEEIEHWLRVLRESGATYEEAGAAYGRSVGKPDSAIAGRLRLLDAYERAGWRAAP